VTGSVHPERVLTNRKCRVGDALILTKPLGTGVLFNANRSGRLPYRELEAILPQIAALNREAIDIASNFEIHACTDITGFGILGHTLEMAKGSGVQIDLHHDQLPLYPNALEMYRKGQTTGSNKANRQLAEGFCKFSTQRSAAEEELLFDPQTSGGLLLSLAGEQAEDVIRAMREAGLERVTQVGEVVTGDRPLVRVV
jgi:selenide,water dikinase